MLNAAGRLQKSRLHSKERYSMSATIIGIGRKRSTNLRTIFGNFSNARSITSSTISREIFVRIPLTITGKTVKQP